MAKSGMELLRDASEIRRVAVQIAKTDKVASDALKVEAHRVTMRAIKRIRTRVPRRGRQSPRGGGRGSAGGVVILGRGPNG